MCMSRQLTVVWRQSSLSFLKGPLNRELPYCRHSVVRSTPKPTGLPSLKDSLDRKERHFTNTTVPSQSCVLTFSFTFPPCLSRNLNLQTTQTRSQRGDDKRSLLPTEKDGGSVNTRVYSGSEHRRPGRRPVPLQTSTRHLWGPSILSKKIVCQGVAVVGGTRAW